MGYVGSATAQTQSVLYTVVESHSQLRSPADSGLLCSSRDGLLTVRAQVLSIVT